MWFYEKPRYWFFDSGNPFEAKRGKGRRRLGHGERPASWRIRK